MLTELAKKGKRVLITIDEVVNNDYVKVFISAYQLFLREKLPVFLLMTGLYDNIYNLQNEKTLTFLYRAPKIILKPLPLGSIAGSYAEVLPVEEEKAAAMARLTKGYPYAYQVLGYLYWKKNVDEKGSGRLEDLLAEYDELLEEYVYEKIWSELSSKEKEILAQIPADGSIRIAEIRQRLSMPSNAMSVYRERLKRKGVVDASEHGKLAFSLPRFGEIIRFWI